MSSPTPSTEREPTEREPTGAVVGRVLGTEDATPLEFWVGITDPSVRHLQLDDVVTTTRTVTDRSTGERIEVRIAGVVSQVRSRHVGTRFDSDVHLVADGLLPAEVSESACVLATRFEPEVFVPPEPGRDVVRAEGAERDHALLFDTMDRRLPAGLTPDGQPLYVNMDFVDGARGGHINISGISGVATKTSYATFLLHAMFQSGLLGASAHNAKALIFNVKGEDLLYLDRPNAKLSDADRRAYAAMGLPATAFSSVGLWAPPRRDDPNAVANVASRGSGVTSFYWTLEEFCRDELLPFVFADAEDDRAGYTAIIQHLTTKLRLEAKPVGDGSVVIGGVTVRDYDGFVNCICDLLDDPDDLGTRNEWAGRSVATGSIAAFNRRFYGSAKHLRDLIRTTPERRRSTAIDTDATQVTVVDLHALHDRAKRFVVGVVTNQVFLAKERTGVREPVQFLVLDELNKYAPREGNSPIKEMLLDVAERGRSLGVILIGAQQTASEVARRIVANSSIRVVGRLDAAESGRDEYGFLPTAQRQRATILKPGTMIVAQPELPVPLVATFPFPAWATRADEDGSGHALGQGDAPWDLLGSGSGGDFDGSGSAAPHIAAPDYAAPDYTAADHTAADNTAADNSPEPF